MSCSDTCVFLEGLREVAVRTVALRLSRRLPVLRMLISSLVIGCSLPGNVSHSLCWSKQCKTSWFLSVILITFECQETRSLAASGDRKFRLGDQFLDVDV